jgi:hypothetical protein
MVSYLIKLYVPWKYLYLRKDHISDQPFINFFFQTFLIRSKCRSGVNFINIQLTAFTLADAKSVKKDTDDLTVFF